MESLVDLARVSATEPSFWFILLAEASTGKHLSLQRIARQSEASADKDIKPLLPSKKCNSTVSLVTEKALPPSATNFLLLQPLSEPS